ncbi:uncharacterized protein [Montipora foliosa]|uniref:uncharacterized protein isoform X2 n=1 Tax=Montipora foliosa TaxID=591990 RepID=UPI0035F20CDF
MDHSYKKCTASSNQPEDNTASDATVFATSAALSSPQSSAPLSHSSPSSPTLPFVQNPPLSPLPLNMQLSAHPGINQSTRRTDNFRPRGGLETRRYLATLAGSNTDGSDISFITIPESDEDDTDLLHNDVAVNPPPPVMQFSQVQRQRPPFNLLGTTSTITRATNVISQSSVRRDRLPYTLVTSSTQALATNVTSQGAGFAGAPFHGDGMQVGTIKEDLFPYGLGGTSVSMESRSDETNRCERLLQGSCAEENTFMVPLLNHSFEEICWQAYEDQRAVVTVLLNPSSRSQFQANMLSVLQNVQENSSREDWFFWAAETTSENGKKVLEKYGNGCEDQIIFLVPSTQQTPVFVDRIEGPVLNDFDQTRLCDKIKAMIHGLSMERKRRDQWRELRRQQENELQQMTSGNDHQLGIVDDNPAANSECQAIIQTKVQQKDITTVKETTHSTVQQKDISTLKETTHSKEPLEDKSEEINIRRQRHLRLLAEPKDGVQLRVRLNNIEEPLTRYFSRNALYQEVYDWVGSMEKAPLYFTLHTQGKLIKHADEVEGNSVVHVTEREAGQVAMLLGSEVSFRGNFEGSKELHATMTDDPTRNSTSGRNQEREGEKELKKRKDKRATAERKRAKKEKAAKNS